MDIKDVYDLVKEVKTENKEQHNSIKTKQDYTNGNVRTLQQWKSFMIGGMTVISMFLIPIIIYLVVNINNDIISIQETANAQSNCYPLDK